jgi:hypothetical protein
LNNSQMTYKVGGGEKEIMADTTAGLSSIAQGDIIQWDGNKYKCVDEGNDGSNCNADGTSYVDPSRTEANTGTLWDMMPTPPSDNPSQEQIEKYIADSAECVEWSASYKFIQYQWACGATDQFRCLQPALCSSVHPDDISYWNGPVTGSDWGNTIETGSTAIWATNETDTPSYRGLTLALGQISKTKMDASARDVADCGTWQTGAVFYKDDLVCSRGSIFECLDTTLCSTEQPGTGSAWAVPTESGLENPPASKQVKLSNWVRHNTVADLTNADYAYEIGSVASTRSGATFTCDPATAYYGS